MDCEITTGGSVDTSALDAFVSRVEAELSDVSTGPMSDTMKMMSDEVMAGQRERFTSLMSGGGEWADNALSTKIAWLYKQGVRVGRVGAKRGVNRMADIAASSPKLILYDEGGLFNSLRRGEPGYYEVLLPDRIVFGTDHFTAIFHQEGTSRMPQRRIIVSIDELSGFVRQATQDTLISGMKELYARAISSL